MTTMRLNRMLCAALVGIWLAGLGCGRASDSIKPPGDVAGKRSAEEASEPLAKMPEKAEPKVDPTAIPKPPPLNPEAFEIKETGTGDWRRTSISAETLAQRIGNAFRNMKDTFGQSISTIKTPKESGQVQSRTRVKDYKTYSIETLQLASMPGLIEIRADGSKKASTKESGGFAKPIPLATGGPEVLWKGKDLVERWPRSFPRLAFLGLTDGRDAWEPYIRELMSGRSGFTGEIAERTLMHRGKPTRSYRLVARRTPERAKALGPCEIEMVFDGQRYLPVTVRVNMEEPGKGEWKVLWQTGWNFGQKFDAKAFALPN